MKKFISLLILLSLLMGLNCASVRVNVNYDESVDFMQYRSFFLVKNTQNRVTPRGQRRPLIFTKAVTDEIKETLQIKGFAETAVKANADLLVIFYTQIHNRRDVIQPSYRVGRWGRVWRTSPGRVVHYKEGTLVIDIVDQARKELIWQVVVNCFLDRVDPSSNLAESAV